MKGIVQDRYRIKAWVLPVFENIPIAGLNRTMIEEWLDMMALSPKKSVMNAGCVPKGQSILATEDQKRARKASANRILAVFKAALNFCLDRGLASSSDRPWQLVKPFKGTFKARLRSLTIDEQVKLVSACPDDFGRLVRGALFTGCRYGEITRLRVRDYDSANGSVFVSESKSGRPRHVFLSQEGIDFFNTMTTGVEPDAHIFVKNLSKDGKQTRNWISREQCLRMRKACALAKIEQATFHELRHTYASMLMNCGCMVSVVAELLGHSSTKMVEKHYGHLSRSTVRDELLRTMPKLGFLSA